VISTFDTWSSILSVAKNSDTEDKGPSENNNLWTSYLFFFSFILVGVMFFLNLFMGVIFANFLRAQRKTNNKNLDNNQFKYIQILNSVLDAKPYLYFRPAAGMKRFCYDLVNGKFFEIIIVFCCLSYICLLTMYKEDSPPQFYEIVDICSLILAAFLNIECCIKLMSQGRKGFVSSNWNIIEMVIVVIFNVTLFLTEMLQRYNFINHFSLIMRILWIFRMIIFLRIYQRFYFFRKLLRVLKFSISLYINLAFLFILTILIYGLIGCIMYPSLQSGQVISPFLNFQNIFYSMFILLKIAVCDSWSSIVFDCFQANSFCNANNDICKISENNFF